MSVAVAATVGATVALGTFLLLRRDLVRVVWGVAILSQGGIVYVLSMGGIPEGTADTVPILAEYDAAPATADPLVQALVLTAIVIGFGTTAFALVLSYRAYQENDTMDVGRWE